MECSHEHTHEGAATTLSALGRNGRFTCFIRLCRGTPALVSSSERWQESVQKYSWSAYESWKKPVFSPETSFPDTCCMSSTPPPSAFPRSAKSSGPWDDWGEQA